MTMPKCPQCGMDHTYSDTEFYICPDCGNEWSMTEEMSADELTARDAHGNILKDVLDEFEIKARYIEAKPNKSNQNYNEDAWIFTK